MNREINYEIDNCITDLEILICLDKRAMKDLENNTHEIEQQEVLTIIREFIRLRNDYNKKKQKNKDLTDKCIELATTIDSLETDLKDMDKKFRYAVPDDMIHKLYVEKELYEQERERNKELEICLKSEQKYSEGLNRDIKSLLNIEPNNNFISKDKIEKEFEKFTAHNNCFNLGDMQLLLDNIIMEE